MDRNEPTKEDRPDRPKAKGRYRGRETAAGDLQTYEDVLAEAKRGHQSLKENVNERARRSAEELIERIIALRKARGFSQAELARRMGLPQAALALWENGHRMPTATSLTRMVLALNATIKIV